MVSTGSSQKKIGTKYKKVMATLLECTTSLSGDSDEKCICGSAQDDCMRYVVENDLLNCRISSTHDKMCERQQDASGNARQYAMGASGQLECCDTPP